MANLSQQKRQRMLEFIDKIREEHKDDDEMLIALGEIENELNSKKYGLVWEQHEEAVDVMMKDNIPVFSECKDKEIIADDSGNFNFLLEGDNLHSLKLLEKTHAGKIDVILIDPPYNTEQKEFIYDDTKIGSEDNYRHSKWISFMYRRLKIARELMSKNSLIFIHIDDNEQATLKLLCDEIFGESNFVNCISVKMSEPTGLKMAHVEKKLPKLKEYILCYKKGNPKLKNIQIPKEKWDDEYKILIKGITKEEVDVLKEILYSDNPTLEDISRCDLICKNIIFGNINELFTSDMKEDEKLQIKYQNAWRIVRDVATTGAAKKIADSKRDIAGSAFMILTPKKKVYFIRNGYNINSSQPRIKLLFADNYLTVNPCDFWADIKTTGLDNEGYVEFPNGKKPLKSEKRLLEFANNQKCTVLDFFAGSGTTGHAVLKLNQEDGGNRKFILCTNNENNICEEITYERIKRVINGYGDVEGIPANLKYYRTDFVSKDAEDVSDELLKHIKEMIQLEHGIQVDDSKYLILLTDEDADELELRWDEYSEIKALYVSRNVLFTSKQNALFANVEVHIIPDDYFKFELQEVGEAW